MRIALALAVLSVLVAADASAQRRRSVKTPAAAPVTPGAQCAEYGSARIGMKASYAVTSNSGNITYTVTYVSDNGKQAVTTQKVQTPQGSSDVETRMDFETVRAAFDLRALRHLYVKSTTSAAGFVFAVETDIDFVPAMVLGPAGGWCTGAKWSVPATTETITVRSPAGVQTSTQTTIAYEGEVLAVGEVVTTPAGTFRCIKARGLSPTATSTDPTISWNSIDHYITVKQQTLDAQGRVTSTTELVKLE